MATDFELALKHKYRLEHNGPLVPGVTTVIDVLDKPALKWSASGIAAQTAIENGRKKKGIVKTHREKLLSARGKGDDVRKKHELANNGTDNEVYAHWCRAQFDVQWRVKAQRGTRVHDVAERLTRGESVEVQPSDKGFVDAWSRFYDEYKPRFHYAENIVGGRTTSEGSEYQRFAPNELPYGGRFDFIAELHGPGADGLYLGDYKSGGEYLDSVALQTVGYMRAELIEYDAKGSISGFNPLPELDGARVIYLREDGTCGVKDPFEKIDESDAWRAFSACNTLYATMKSINASLGKESDD